MKSISELEVGRFYEAGGATIKVLDISQDKTCAVVIKRSDAHYVFDVGVIDDNYMEFVSVFINDEEMQEYMQDYVFNELTITNTNNIL